MVNAKEMMLWLTLKQANATSFLTMMMVPHVVAAWLDEEEHDAMKGMSVCECILVLLSKLCQKNILASRTFCM